MIKLEDLLIEMVERKSSDLFLKAGSPPNCRVDGQINSFDYGVLTPDDSERFAREMPWSCRPPGKQAQ